jgi:hypothetical protein
MLVRTVTLSTYIRKVHGSGIGWFTGFPDVVRGLLYSSGQIVGKYLKLDHERFVHIFPTYYSPIILSLDAQ